MPRGRSRTSSWTLGIGATSRKPRETGEEDLSEALCAGVLGARGEVRERALRGRPGAPRRQPRGGPRGPAGVYRAPR
eukprot:535610-Pyramimonas_sp.AAC.1